VESGTASMQPLRFEAGMKSKKTPCEQKKAVGKCTAMKSIRGVRPLGIFVWLLLGTHQAWAQPVPAAPSNPEGPGSTYPSLRPPQKRLVDDWFARLSAVVQRPVDPSESYENLPLSTRTTFNAVTHALLMTKLTDESGNSLADSAIEVVEKVDSVAGQVLGERGDHQFRIYVEMKGGAMALLTRSKEFRRTADNTVYHKGYPICFRSTGGTPSIQISLTRDQTRADIDVDYRSSRFPIGLVNGHLTASNSDIRAGGNDGRHNGQWAGMENWWRNLLGLPWAETVRLNSESGEVMPSEPRLKSDKPSDAVYDFLNGWLVEQHPEQSVAYFAEQSFACVDKPAGTAPSRGVMMFALLQRMNGANAQIGKVSSLGDVTLGVAVSSDRMRVIQQPRHSTFVLYDVREDLAEEFKCANRLDSSQVSPKAMKSRAFGKYVGALFTIKGRQEMPGKMVATLWQRERGYWKLISYDFDPEIDRSRVPNVGSPLSADAPLDYVQGDSDMVKAASSFMKEWLVRKNIDKALEYIAPECLACVNLYRGDDDPAPSTPAESRELLKKGMARLAETIGSTGRLSGAIVAPDVRHPAVKLVKHSEDSAFVIASIPDSMGIAADCGRRGPDGEPDFGDTAATGYGTYYATGFALSGGNMDAATLWIVWRKVDGSWKVLSYVLLSP
jgi:hypothetical protein